MAKYRLLHHTITTALQSSFSEAPISGIQCFYPRWNNVGNTNEICPRKSKKEHNFFLLATEVLLFQPRAHRRQGLNSIAPVFTKFVSHSVFKDLEKWKIIDKLHYDTDVTLVLQHNTNNRD